MSDQEFVEYWMRKAEQDLAKTCDILKAGRLQNAVRDAYFWSVERGAIFDCPSRTGCQLSEAERVRHLVLDHTMQGFFIRMGQAVARNI